MPDEWSTTASMRNDDDIVVEGVARAGGSAVGVPMVIVADAARPTRRRCEPAHPRAGVAVQAKQRDAAM